MDAPKPAAVRRAPRKGAPPPQDDTLGALPEAAAEKAGGKADGKKRRKASKQAPKAEAQPEPKPKTKAAPESAPARAVRKDRTEPLNFRVSAEFRRAFKRAAAAQDCKKVDLLERIFAEWSARNPG